jgi:hypothetical protein
MRTSAVGLVVTPAMDRKSPDFALIARRMQPTLVPLLLSARYEHVLKSHAAHASADLVIACEKS